MNLLGIANNCFVATIRPCTEIKTGNGILSISGGEKLDKYAFMNKE